MTDAQTILKMIEEVDPSDTAKLDEIDARVLEFVNEKGILFRWNCNLEFTRSRDALKTIRPEGYSFRIRASSLSNNCKAVHIGRVPTASFSFECYRTEELAELHAIIQAIEFERKKNE